MNDIYLSFNGSFEIDKGNEINSPSNNKIYMPLISHKSSEDSNFFNCSIVHQEDKSFQKMYINFIRDHDKKIENELINFLNHIKI